MSSISVTLNTAHCTGRCGDAGGHVLRTLGVICVVGLLITSLCHAADGPVLARVSFWVPPERMGEFEAVYQDKVLPVLKARDLKPSEQKGRPTPDNVFRRLFHLETMDELRDKQGVLTQFYVVKCSLCSIGIVSNFNILKSEGLIRFPKERPSLRLDVGT